MQARKQLNRCAAKAGIDLVGVCSPQRLAWLLDHLTLRQAEGYTAPFTPREPADRVELERIFSGVKSVISVGMAYDPADQADQADQADRTGLKQETVPQTGLLAGFACCPDYHAVLQEKIKLMMSLWEESFGCSVKWKAFVDTGPAVDRAVAWQAGLGEYGKNCLLINKSFGSWFVLGVILTDFLLPPDGRPGTPPDMPGAPDLPSTPDTPKKMRHVPLESPSANLCGTCELCLHACPTGALEGPYRLNAYRCISYLTQASGYIPQDLRPAMGRQIYGCDLCQQVCPHNRLVRKNAARQQGLTGPEAPPPKNISPEQELEALLNISNRDFAETWGATAAGWRGKKILQRNAVIALGNIGSPHAIPMLIKVLKDSRPLLRGHAAWALGRIGGEQARSELERALDYEQDPAVLTEVRAALNSLAKPRDPSQFTKMSKISHSPDINDCYNDHNN